MHSIWARVSNGSATLSSFMMALLAAIALSTFVFTADPKGTVSVASVKVQLQKIPRYPSRKRETAVVNFNINADLSPLFNWNTKQIFLYLSAEYTNPQGVQSEVVFWDRIVRRKEDAYIKFVGRNKYILKDISASFKNASDAQYSLKYNIMPHVGVLTYGEAARTTPVSFHAIGS
ncbi:signal peptidase subunit [Mycena floridula]|nr:signal peptidase subunit [Mycena floridula]